MTIDSRMVDEFLHQRGLQRMQLLFRQHRIELSGLLFGQLMNCGLFSQAPLYIQAPLVSEWIESSCVVIILLTRDREIY